MTPDHEHHQKIKAILQEILGLDPEKRSAYLEEVHKANPGLREELESHVFQLGDETFLEESALAAFQRWNRDDSPHPSDDRPPDARRRTS